MIRQAAHVIPRKHSPIPRKHSSFTPCGAMLERSAGGFSMVATDGRRLVHSAHSWEQQAADTSSVVIPLPLLSRLARLLPSVSTGDAVRILSDQHYIWFRFGAIEVMGRLLPPVFPNWRNVIGKSDNMPCAAVNGPSLAAAIKRVIPFATNKLANTKTFPAASFTLGARRVAVSAAADSFIGEASDSVDAVSPGDALGEAVTIDINPEYVLAALSALDCDSVVIHYADSRHAIRIAAGESEAEFCLIMPLRLPG